MADFIKHTKESAPAASRTLLEGTERAVGFVPNLLGILAEAPAALQAYIDLNKALATTSLTPIERQVALLSVSFENDCRYCMAAHSHMAYKAGASKEVVDALRDGDPLPDPRLDALARFTRALVRERGRVGEEEVQGFLRAGFRKAQILEVLVAVATKTLSNYTNHLAHTELDEAARPFAWEKPSAIGETTCPHP